VDRSVADQDDLSGARRLYSAALAPAPGASLELEAEAREHARVLRLAPGDPLELFDGRGYRQRVELTQLDRRSAVVRALTLPEQVARGPRVVLVQCQPKGTKLDEIVRMTTELGVSAIHVALSEFCVARSEGSRADLKAERWRRIAREAVRQSERYYVPEITAAAPLAEVLSRAPAGAARWALMERHAQPLPWDVPGGELWLVVGPEGGFSGADRALLTRSGFDSAGLGDAILRTETAAVVGVALGLERFGIRR
jgi:16S rRNA (uracil1498-N3)-methyltransferase